MGQLHFAKQKTLHYGLKNIKKLDAIELALKLVEVHFVPLVIDHNPGYKS